MFKQISIITCLCLFTAIVSQAQTYVNSIAAGANDGSSWADAYRSLDVALAETASGDIWIAAGTYRHVGAAPDSFRTFLISSDIDLYGGFAGTESTLEQRDISSNLTLLSADFNRDDTPGDFETFRSDNSYHVITVDSFIASSVIIDGLTISGGNTNNNTDLSQYNRRGAGIYSWSTIEIRNCTFTDNYANAGASIFIDPARGGGSGSKLTNNLFTKNRATSRGAGVYFFGLSDIIIADNVFTENWTSRGCVYPFRSDNIVIKNNEFTRNKEAFAGGFTVGIFIFQSTNVVIDSCNFIDNEASSATGLYYEAPDSTAGVDNLVITNCLFDNNTATTGFGGGAMYFWQATGVRIEKTIFKNNSAGNGGVFYQDGRRQFADQSNLVFTDCEFLDNSSFTADGGGGVGYTWQSSMTFDNCLFQGNTGESGAVLGFYGNNHGKNLILSNCEFKDNTSLEFGTLNLQGNSTYANITNSTFEGNKVGGGGAGIFAGFEITVDIDSCSFIGNMGVSGGGVFTQSAGTNVTISNTDFIGNQVELGGGVFAGFRANTIVENCIIETNSAEFGGGVFLQSDSTVLRITNSRLQENTATESGGAIYQVRGAIMHIDRSEVVLNSAVNGGGITAVENDEDLVPSKLYINNSKFSFNSATGQGGAINVIGTDAMITNSVINNNFNLGGISGGGISGNGREMGDVTNIYILNSTIAENDGPVGAGIGIYSGQRDSSIVLTLQNTILANEGKNFEIEAGDFEVISNGGNVSSDTTLTFAFQENLQDKVSDGQDIFVDPGDSDFHLIDGSPAINIGQLPAPEFDIEMLPRVGTPDAGAYEYQLNVSVEEELIKNIDQLFIAPNPVSRSFNLTLKNEWKGEVNARLFSRNGQLLDSWNFNKNAPEVSTQINISTMPAGIYDLVVGNGKFVLVQRLIKIR